LNCHKSYEVGRFELSEGFQSWCHDQNLKWIRQRSNRSCVLNNAISLARVGQAWLGIRLSERLGMLDGLDVVRRSSSLEKELLTMVMWHIHRANPVFAKGLESHSYPVDSAEALCQVLEISRQRDKPSFPSLGSRSGGSSHWNWVRELLSQAQ
jgi:hypothetical protein